MKVYKIALHHNIGETLAAMDEVETLACMCREIIEQYISLDPAATAKYLASSVTWQN